MSTSVSGSFSERQWPSELEGPFQLSSYGKIPVLPREVEAEFELPAVGRASVVYIRWVQIALNRSDNAKLEEDGRSGPSTRAAVARFQRAHGLSPDGVVGPATESALAAASGVQAPLIAAPPTSVSASRARYAQWSDVDDQRKGRRPRDQVINGVSQRVGTVLVYPNPAKPLERTFLLVNFKIDGAGLRPEHRQYLSDVARGMTAGPPPLIAEAGMPLARAWRVIAEAHASRTGAERHNDVLSEDRYLTTRAFLETELLRLGADPTSVRFFGEGVGFRHSMLPGEDPRMRSVFVVVEPEPALDPAPAWPPSIVPVQFPPAKTAITCGAVAWTPPIRSDELGPGKTDRLASRTFDCGMFSVYVPSSAASVTTNRVHVFFSPGSVTGPSGSNAVAVHGLRGAAEAADWILMSVPGVLGSFNTITDANILDSLRSIGRSATIDSLRLSAHSRGAAGLAATLQGKLITASLIDRVILLDVTDFAAGITRGLQASGVPASRVTAYNVVFGAFPLAGVQNLQIPFNGVRSIGYARLIQDGIATGRAPAPLPTSITSRIGAITLPARGNFTTRVPTPAGKTSLSAFCSNPSNTAALTDLRFGEPTAPTDVLVSAQLTARAPNSPYAFIEENNVMGFNNPTIPKAQWTHFSPQIYSHHLFVAELAHEVLG